MSTKHGCFARRAWLCLESLETSAASRGRCTSSERQRWPKKASSAQSSTFEEAVNVARAAGRSAAGSIGNLGYVALLQGDYAHAEALCQEAVGQFRERGHEGGVAVGLGILADAALLLGRTEEARLRLRECLELARSLAFKEVIASCLETSAALLARERVRVAARLTGAADALRDEINLTQAPAERSVHDGMRATLRASLPPRAREDLQNEGRKLDAEQAIALALASLD